MLLLLLLLLWNAGAVLIGLAEEVLILIVFVERWGGEGGEDEM